MFNPAASGINTPAGAQGTARNDEALKKAARELESVFYYYMIKAMRDTVPKDGLFDGGNEEEMMTGLLDQQLSVDMAQGGHGSLSERVLEQMRHQMGLDKAGQNGGKAAGAYADILSGAAGAGALGDIGVQDLLGQMPVPVSPASPGPATAAPGLLDPFSHTGSSAPAAVPDIKTVHPMPDIRSSVTPSGHEDAPELAMSVTGRISSLFGMRKDPFTGSFKNHGGIDIAAASGSEIKPAAPGKVIFAGERGGYGNLVIVDHGGGITTYYAHNSQNLVKEGDLVGRGDAVALVGSTGRSTGPHIHFEVHKDGHRVDPSFALARHEKFSKVL